LRLHPRQSADRQAKRLNKKIFFVFGGDKIFKRWVLPAAVILASGESAPRLRFSLPARQAFTWRGYAELPHHPSCLCARASVAFGVFR